MDTQDCLASRTAAALMLLRVASLGVFVLCLLAVIIAKLTLGWVWCAVVALFALPTAIVAGYVATASKEACVSVSKSRHQ